MHPVTISNIGPGEAIDFKGQLLEAGLVMNHDFFWKYHPSRWDNFTGKTGGNYAMFYFHDPATATFYQLKWS